jgi:L-malate glycosyltransferase
MSRIRVLHIIWSASPGGIDRIVFNLCKTQLKNDTVQPSILIAKSDNALNESYKNLGIKVYEPGFISGSDSRKEIIAVCMDAFMEHDILHFHSFNPTLAKTAVKSGKKIVFTEHGNFGFGRKTTLKDYAVRYMQKRFLNNEVDFITFNSEFSKSIAENRFNLSKVKRQVVYNGIPILDPQKKEIDPGFTPDPNKLKVLTIGRLATVKRIDRLLRAFAGANPYKMQLIITGDGPLRKEFEKLSHKLEIEEHTHFTGFQVAHSMIEFADICVFPSQNEAFGLVAIEAYHCGKPVIVFRDGGGLAELVQKIEPEMIVNTEMDLSALLVKCQNALNEFTSEKLQDMRKQFASGFSIEKMESQLSTIYSGL